MTEDAFGTAALRRAVTEAWLASPTRFREDANTEEDHARGYYRDRVVVELAQNAADAAAHARAPGRLVLRLAPDASGSWWLTAENSGEPLDARGVASLASMRASAKVVPTKRASDGARRAFPATASGSGPTAELQPVGEGPGRVGRFGVGFAAVRSVADEIVVRSTLGGVVFSLDRTRDALDGLTRAPGGERAEQADADRLAAAVLERGAALPVLRLPFPTDPLPASPAGPTLAGLEPSQGRDLAGPDRAEGAREPGGPWAPDTVVSLRLRDEQAVLAVRHQLDELDDALLLALPALAEVVVVVADTGEVRHLQDADARWTVLREAGESSADLLASLPVEQQHAGWSLLWALPHEPTAVSGLLHAPTPTDERLTFPALLIASFPLDPSRRHVLPGPVTEDLAARAGEAYARLLARLAAWDAGGASIAASVPDVQTGHLPGIGRSHVPGHVPGNVLGLVPTGLPTSEVDARIREVALDALRGTRLLAPVREDRAATAHRDDQDEPDAARYLVAPRDAQVLAGEVGRDPDVLRVLGRWVPGLVDVPSPFLAVARSLGVQSRDLADVLDELPAGMGPSSWREVYAVLAPHRGQPGVLDALGAVTVPLADGRTVRGARGTLLLSPGDEVPGADGASGAAGSSPFLALARSLGLRLVHPEAAHPLLERLGATVSSARTLLEEPAVRDHVLHLADEAADGDPLLGDLADVGDDGPALWTSRSPALDAEADMPAPDPDAAQGDVPSQVPSAVGQVLALVRAALDEGALPAELPFWLGELPLPTADGDLSPARECVLPGSWAAEHLDGLVPLAAEAEPSGAWSEDVLRAVGVQADVSVYRVADVLTPWARGTDLADDAADPADPQSWLAGWTDYLDFLAGLHGGGAYVGDLDGVADLDAVADDAWPAFLARLAHDPDARAALLDPVRGQGSARAGDAPSYTAWWLRRHLGAPFAAQPGTVPFLADPPPAVRGLDAEVVRALGGVVRLEDLDPADWSGYLAALPDVGTPLPLTASLAVWRGLGALARRVPAADVLDELPERLPGLRGGRATCVAAEDLAVATSAMWAQVRTVLPVAPDGAGDAVRAGEALADLLDLPLLPTPRSTDVPLPDGEGSRQVVDARVVGLVEGVPEHWFEHDVLTVDGVEVDWWVCAGGGGPEVHAATTSGLARGLAAAAGRADTRYLLEVALLDPDAADELLAESAWDGADPPR
ncbi:ATP-binding protein [Oerskovia sp. NPDC060287]|uniref:ATP-binding protein n=1 Tax=Oerskovia sp. NPDC060287 TaxID=3347095 RepID=UPI0036479B31